jgi:hypothetical protein
MYWKLNCGNRERRRSFQDVTRPRNSNASKQEGAQFDTAQTAREEATKEVAAMYARDVFEMAYSESQKKRNLWEAQNHVICEYQRTMDRRRPSDVKVNNMDDGAKRA